MAMCIFRNCSNAQMSCSKLTFFRLPNDERRTTWIAASGNHELQSIPATRKLKRVVCERHFDERYLCKQFNRTILRRNAVPNRCSDENITSTANVVEPVSDNHLAQMNDMPVSNLHAAETFEDISSNPVESFGLADEESQMKRGLDFEVVLSLDKPATDHNSIVEDHDYFYESDTDHNFMEDVAIDDSSGIDQLGFSQCSSNEMTSVVDTNLKDITIDMVIHSELSQPDNKLVDVPEETTTTTEAVYKANESDLICGNDSDGTVFKLESNVKHLQQTLVRPKVQRKHGIAGRCRTLQRKIRLEHVERKQKQKSIVTASNATTEEDTYFALSLVGTLQRLKPMEKAIAKVNILRYLTELEYSGTAALLGD